MEPPRRVDAFLSRKAQAVWPGALVYCLALPGGQQSWGLERPHLEPLGLGDRFSAAHEALRLLIVAEEQRKSP